MAENNFSQTEQSHEYDNLVQSGLQVDKRAVSLSAGIGEVKRGALMVKNASNEYLPYTGATGEVPEAILAENVNVPTGNVQAATVYLAGGFSERVVGNLLPSGTEIEDIREDLRLRNIILKPSVDTNTPPN